MILTSTETVVFLEDFYGILPIRRLLSVESNYSDGLHFAFTEASRNVKLLERTTCFSSLPSGSFSWITSNSQFTTVTEPSIMVVTHSGH